MGEVSRNVSVIDGMDDFNGLGEEKRGERWRSAINGHGARLKIERKVAERMLWKEDR